jgi:hypothetical protein
LRFETAVSGGADEPMDMDVSVSFVFLVAVVDVIQKHY